MISAAPLSPAEALVLLDPARTPAREALKVTLMSLLAQRILRIDEEEHRGILRTTKSSRLRLAGGVAPTRPAHVASLVSVVRAAENGGGGMTAIVAQARKTYGNNLQRFKAELILPMLTGRGLIVEGVRKTLLIFTRKSWDHTPAGLTEKRRIEGQIAQARRIPELLKSNPAEAAAIALAVGGTLLLVSELKPFYGQLGDAMHRYPGDSGSASDGGSGSDFSFASVSGDAGALDLGSFDAEAFSALDSGLDAFDSGFDSAADSGGDSGGGDSGGGDSGGSGC